MPPTVPDDAVTEAMEALLLLHVPPDIGFPNDVVLPTHTAGAPLIGDSGLTENDSVV